MQRIPYDNSDGRRWWVGTCGLLLVGLLATMVQGQEPTPALELLLNQETFTAGSTLSLTGSVDPQGTVVDVYLALLLPTGDLFFLTPDGEFTATPISLTPNGLAEAASAEIFNITLTGAEPPGQYAWLGALTAHGTAELVSQVAQAPFTVEEATAGSP